MNEALESRSPADPDDRIGRFPVAGESEIDLAVARARAAQPAWRDAGEGARAKVLRRFAELGRARVEELARLIAREVGKALWDARAEAQLLAPKIEVTLDEGMRLVAEQRPAAGLRATTHPRGVLAVYGPFNFPSHLPLGHIAPALATGNTVVFKPSELAPAVGAWLASRWREAGLPDGTLELVQGGRETGSALARHPGLDGILFTGSYATGRALREATFDQPWKLLALEEGGSNPILVCGDADFELAVAETALSIAVTTGQRCSCARRLFVERAIFEPFSERLARVLARVRIGPPLEPGVFMGPLVSRGAHARFEAMRARAREAGGERILAVDPRLPPPYTGPGLVRFDSIRQSHPYQREENFGPEAALYPVADLDEAIAAANDSDYGLAASIFTRDRARYEHCVGRVRTGILNWNRGTVGASGRLPFGGGGRSGNDRPAGVTSTLYCVVPQAHMENEAGFDPQSLPPGLPTP
ncbi:MAG TPA: aldehyde dehydrogenase family protein [Myxococcota bacterium]|nr:aldehyde dehydrogenase family protein [Myxococcota bacterium]